MVARFVRQHHLNAGPERFYNWVKRYNEIKEEEVSIHVRYLDSTKPLSAFEEKGMRETFVCKLGSSARLFTY